MDRVSSREIAPPALTPLPKVPAEAMEEEAEGQLVEFEGETGMFQIPEAPADMGGGPLRATLDYGRAPAAVRNGQIACPKRQGAKSSRD